MSLAGSPQYPKLSLQSSRCSGCVSRNQMRHGGSDTLSSALRPRVATLRKLNDTAQPHDPLSFSEFCAQPSVCRTGCRGSDTGCYHAYSTFKRSYLLAGVLYHTDLDDAPCRMPARERNLTQLRREARFPRGRKSRFVVSAAFRPVTQFAGRGFPRALILKRRARFTV